MSTVVKDLGAVSAYAYAVEKGYTGTEAEFAELMADYAEVGQRAEDAAESALNSKTAAQTAATTATNKASEATTAAQTATTKAGEASQSASNANTAKEEAAMAKTAAETAQGKAEDAQAAAERVAESISSDYSQLSEDVSDLKEDLSAMSTATSSDVGKALKAKTVTDGKVTEWEFGEAGSTIELDDTLTSPTKAAQAKAVGDAVQEINDKIEPLIYGVENLAPYDPSRITIPTNQGSLAESEYSHDYAIKVNGGYYGSATPEIKYTLPEAPSIASTDIMYLAFDFYADAEQSELNTNMYRVIPFGKNLNQGEFIQTARTWTTFRKRYAHGSTINADVLVRPQFTDRTAAENKMLHIRNLVIINLTQTFGAGNEPTLEDMDAILEAHDGYIGSVNLFDAKQVTEDVKILNDFKTDATANIMVNVTNYERVGATGPNDGTSYAANESGATVSKEVSVPSSTANGDIIYFFGEFRVLSDADNCLQLAPSSNTKGEKSVIENPKNGVWYPCSARIEKNAVQRHTQFVAKWESSASIRIYHKHVVALNLTEIFGAYNEPTKEMLDQYFYNASLGNAIDFESSNTKMFNLSSPSRKLVHPNGCYVMIDGEGNVKIGSVPDPNWSGWTEIGTYGQFNRGAIPIYNKVHGTLETDGMLSVLPIWGCWSEAASSQNTHHGGHVFHGWTTDRLHRLTMVQNIYRDDEAAVFNYIPGDKSGTSEGGFLRLRLGADNNYKGVLIDNIYDPTTQNPYSTYQMARMTVYGRLNVGKPQNYNHIPASSSADGVKGDFCFDSDYAYFCVADNTWKRIPLQSW